MEPHSIEINSVYRMNCIIVIITYDKYFLEWKKLMNYLSTLIERVKSSYTLLGEFSVFVQYVSTYLIYIHFYIENWKHSYFLPILSLVFKWHYRCGTWTKKFRYLWVKLINIFMIYFYSKRNYFKNCEFIQKQTVDDLFKNQTQL